MVINVRMAANFTVVTFRMQPRESTAAGAIAEALAIVMRTS